MMLPENELPLFERPAAATALYSVRSHFREERKNMGTFLCESTEKFKANRNQDQRGVLRPYIKLSIPKP